MKPRNFKHEKIAEIDSNLVSCVHFQWHIVTLYPIQIESDRSINCFENFTVFDERIRTKSSIEIVGEQKLKYNGKRHKYR